MVHLRSVYFYHRDFQTDFEIIWGSMVYCMATVTNDSDSTDKWIPILQSVRTNFNMNIINVLVIRIQHHELLKYISSFIFTELTIAIVHFYATTIIIIIIIITIISAYIEYRWRYGRSFRRIIFFGNVYS